MQRSASESHPFGQWHWHAPGAEPKTLLELKIDAFTGAIRGKRFWREKLSDEEIVARWTQEGIDQGLSQAQVHFALQVRYCLLQPVRMCIEAAHVSAEERLQNQVSRERVLSAMLTLCAPCRRKPARMNSTTSFQTNVFKSRAATSALCSDQQRNSHPVRGAWCFPD